MKREGAIRVYLLGPDPQQIQVMQQYMEQQEDLVCAGAGIDGGTLLHRLQNGANFDVLICDAMLRDMDAAELLERMGRLGLPKLPRILVMLGRANRVIQNHLLSLGADLCLSLPCSMETMFRRARVLCGSGELDPNLRLRRMLSGLGLVPDDSGYRYLTKALEIMAFAQQPCAIVKDVYAEVARVEHVSPLGVESGIRRLMGQMKKQDSVMYRELEAMCGGEMSNSRLLRMLAERHKNEIERLEEERC